MMMEHKLKKILRLVIGDQEGTQDSETMPNKEDIEKNVEEILKMLHAEVNYPTSSEISSDKSELASRIDNFHKGFRAVHGRYDHLMGELKKILSCDLKSDEREKLNKDAVSFEEHQILRSQLEDVKGRNDELEALCQEMNACAKERKNIADEFAEKIEVLTGDLDASLKSQGETNQMLRSLHAENEILSSQNAEASSRILEAKKHIEELILLNRVLTEKNKKQSGLIDQLKREKKTLSKGNIEFLKRIQKAEKGLQKAEKAVADVREKAVRELKLVHEEMRSQNSKLKAMEDLKAESGLLRDENSKLRGINNNLKQELEAKVAENEARALEIGDLKAELTALKAGRSLIVPDTGSSVSENSIDMGKLLEEDLKNCMLVEGETAALNLQIQTRQDELTRPEWISKNLEEINTWTIESLRQERGFIEEEVLRLEVEISGLSKTFSDLETVFEKNSGRIREQISVFSEKQKELKNLSARYREQMVSTMRDELAEKEKELADEYEKKREAIREMSLKIDHLRDNCDNPCTYEFRTFLSSIRT